MLVTSVVYAEVFVFRQMWLTYTRACLDGVIASQDVHYPHNLTYYGCYVQSLAVLQLRCAFNKLVSSVFLVYRTTGRHHTE